MEDDSSDEIEMHVPDAGPGSIAPQRGPPLLLKGGTQRPVTGAEDYDDKTVPRMQFEKVPPILSSSSASATSLFSPFLLVLCPLRDHEFLTR